MLDVRETWARAWPPLLAVGVVSAVGAPAAVASYRHARDVVASTGDTVMAPWLPLSVDGLLVAALVVIWVRRRRGEAAGWGPWGAFLFGMVVTILANLAAVTVPSVTAYAVALFPPLAFAITLELVALVAHRAPVPAVREHRVVADLVASRDLPLSAPAEPPALPDPASRSTDREDGREDDPAATREPGGTDTGSSREADDQREPAPADDRDPAVWAHAQDPIPGWRLIQREFPHLSESRARTAASLAKSRTSRASLRSVQ